MRLSIHGGLWRKALHKCLILFIISTLSGLVVLAMAASSRVQISDAQTRLTFLAQEEAKLISYLSDRAPHTPLSSLPEDLVWSANDAITAEIAMQEMILHLAEEAGLLLLSFGGTGPAQNGPIPALGYEAEMEGSHEAMVAFLSSLEESKPGLAVSSLWVRQLPPQPEQRLAQISMRIMLWGFAPNLRIDETSR